LLSGVTESDLYGAPVYTPRTTTISSEANEEKRVWAFLKPSASVLQDSSRVISDRIAGVTNWYPQLYEDSQTFDEELRGWTYSPPLSSFESGDVLPFTHEEMGRSIRGTNVYSIDVSTEDVREIEDDITNLMVAIKRIDDTFRKRKMSKKQRAKLTKKREDSERRLEQQRSRLLRLTGQNISSNSRHQHQHVYETTIPS